MANIESEAKPTSFIQPVAAPSILGLYGFAGATVMVSAYLANWYGANAQTTLYLAPFAAIFGGVAQFAAAMWGFKARDGLATAMHGLWGSFWISWGLMYILVAAGVLQAPGGYMQGYGFWFVTLAWITWVGMWAAFAENMAMAVTLGVLALASTFMAIALFSGSTWWRIAGGWTLFFSAVAAWYTASAMMLEGVFHRSVLPNRKFKPSRLEPQASSGVGEPGVKRGQ